MLETSVKTKNEAGGLAKNWLESQNPNPQPPDIWATVDVTNTYGEETKNWTFHFTYSSVAERWLHC